MRNRLEEIYNFRSDLNKEIKDKLIEKNNKILRNSTHESFGMSIESILNAMSSSDFYIKYDNQQLKSFYTALVATCIDYRAENVAKASIIISKKNPKINKYEPLEWHPFLDLVKRPNLTYEDLSFTDILEYYSKSMDIGGNVYWHLPLGGNGKHPAEIYPIPFDEMLINKVNNNGVPIEYKRTYTNLTGKRLVQIIPSNEIEHFKTYNQNSQYYGIGIIEKSIQKLAINNQLSNYQYKLLKKGGIPKLAILNTNELSNDAVEFQNEQYAHKYGGAQGTIVFNAGYDIKPIQLNPAEMDFIVSSKFSKEETLNMFRVPGSALGDGGGTNKSTAAVNLLSFNHNVIKPILQKLANRLSMYIFKTYGDDVIVDFILPLPEDPEIVMKQFEIMGNMAKEAKENPYSLQVLNDFRNYLKLNIIS